MLDEHITRSIYFRAEARKKSPHFLGGGIFRRTLLVVELGYIDIV
jgi:hypothetical protein